MPEAWGRNAQRPPPRNFSKPLGRFDGSKPASGSASSPRTGPVGTRRTEGARSRGGPARGGLLRGSPLLRGALGGVAALALLALRLLLLAALAGAGDAGHARQAATASASHRLHHLLGLAEALEQLVDLGDRDTGALGDAGAARAVDLLGVGALERRHRADHRLDAVELAVVEGVELVTHPLHARHHLEHRLERAHLLDGVHLREEVLEGEVLLGEELAGHLVGLALVERASRPAR